MLTSVDQSLSNRMLPRLGIEAQLIKPARSAVLLETLVATIQKHRAAVTAGRRAGHAAGAVARPEPDAAERACRGARVRQAQLRRAASTSWSRRTTR